MSQKFLGALSWIGMALVFAAVAVRVLGAVGAIQVTQQIDQYALYAAWAGLALVVIYTLGQWRDIAAYFKRRNARYGAVAGVSVLVAIGILVAVNYLSARQNKRWDLTANKQFSLSEQTIKLLKSLDAPAKFLVFDQDANFDRFRSRLTEYQYQSKNVQVEYIDADKRPVETKQYDVQQYGTVVIEYKGRTERVTTDAEQDLTNALIKVINPTHKKVYFLGGHGEKDIAGTEREGYSGIADALKRDNFEFDKLVLAQTNMIPADATALILAGPRTDLLESEVPLLNEYLAKQGKLLVLLDPAQNLKQPVPVPRLTGLLEAWGIDATNSVVVDLSGRTTVATVAVAAPPYPGHAITDRFDLVTMFPLVRAIVPAKTPPAGRNAQSFVQTAPRSWAETTFSQLEDTKALAPEPEKGDLPGPVSIAAAVAVPAPATDAANKPATPAAGAEEPAKPETRIAVVGDSDFAANAYLGVEGNRDLFMNTVNWLAQQENLISIRPRDAADRRITMTANQARGVFWLSIVIIPMFVFGSGIYSWWRRR
jgi:ABC-type uncharacterized transport system involved in gliding motility auxiliary subunit